MKVNLREISGDEMAEVIYVLATYALDASPPLPDKAERQDIIKRRQGVTCFALFEDDIPLSCAASSAMTQNVRGALYGMGGIWAVATDPGARRRGYSRRTLERVLVAARDGGCVLSGLYPFRESFYERLGYVTFPQARRVSFDPASLLPLMQQDLGGRVERLAADEGFGLYRTYLEKVREGTHGMALFDHADRERAQRANLWLALAWFDGELVGVMAYALKGDRPTEYTMHVGRFYAHTASGKYLLLQWIARHIDQACRAEMALPPFAVPETWLADLNVVPEPVFRAPMGRVLDVAKIGGMKTGPGRFAARISDPLFPWNERIWAFETVDGMLQVTETGAADCTLTIQALSALIYGTHDPADFPIRGWGDPSPELQAEMRRIFPPRQPHMHEFF